MLPCYAPWGMVQVNIHGDMYPCCFIENTFGNMKDYATVQDAYNNEQFQALRRNLVAGDFKAAGCANCKLLKVNGQGVMPPVDEAKALQDQGNLDAADENFVKNVQECMEGKQKLTTTPAGYTITVSHKCNIDCFMCWQRDEHGNYDHSELPDEVVQKLETIYRSARSLHWVGGEPFALRPVHQFVNDFNTEHNPNLRLIATTNALLLKPSVLEKLARFKNVSLVLSIDGVSKKTYEYIRTGGKWETLLEVMPNLSKVAQERGWSVCINYVVMVSNIHELPAAVQFAKKYKFMIAFDPVHGARLETENLFQYPELIQKVPDWRKYIDEAIRLADETDSTEWRLTGTGTAGDNFTTTPSERFKSNVRQRLDYIRKLLTDGEQKARTKLPPPKRYFFPLNLIMK
jgi:radical SAM protein with 4Fe4S-binding SPASM domain